MSFSSLVKNEIIENKINASCCQRAFAAGLLFGAATDGKSVKIVTDNGAVAHCVNSQLNRTLKSDFTMSVSANGSKYTVKSSVENLINYDKRFFDIAHNNKGSILEKPCCKVSFIKGLFLSCGHISNPEKQYRFEFVMQSEKDADLVVDLISDFGLSPKSTDRSNKRVVYFKDSTSIEEMLTLINATGSVLKLMEIEVEKTVKNNTNRKSNFEQANYFKTYSKSQAQLKAIKKIKKMGMYDSLSDSLKFTALLREQNEDASLNELVEISGESRSGINHRLNKLIEIAESLE